MSRAFVDERDDGFLDDDIPQQRFPLGDGVRNYMTPEGAARVKDELDRLVNGVRPGLSAGISRSVSGNEGAEKEDLAAMRRKLRETDRRITYLTRMMDRLEVVHPTKNPDRVLFGTTVTVVLNKDKRRQFRIVGIDEADPAGGAISWISPVAKALLGAVEGQTVTFRGPDGETKMTVIAVT